MCNCINTINEKLEQSQSNTRIAVPIMFNMNTGPTVATRAVIATEKADSKKREKAKKLFASYCPFCGNKYEISDEKK